MKKIPKIAYTKIRKLIPIVCVDAILIDRGEFLLIRRTEHPEKKRWWVVGGRILKYEKMEDAVKRKIKEEIGIESKIIKIIGVYETFFKKSGFHTVNICFIIKPKSRKYRISLDKTSSGYKFFSKINESWHPYIKTVLTDAGFGK